MRLYDYFCFYKCHYFYTHYNVRIFCVLKDIFSTCNSVQYIYKMSFLKCPMYIKKKSLSSLIQFEIVPSLVRLYLLSLYPPSTSSLGLSSLHFGAPPCAYHSRGRLRRSRSHHVPSCREKHWMDSPDTKHNRVYGTGSSVGTLLFSFPFHSSAAVGFPYHTTPHCACTARPTPTRPSTYVGRRRRWREREKEWQTNIYTDLFHPEMNPRIIKQKAIAKRDWVR